MQKIILSLLFVSLLVAGRLYQASSPHALAATKKIIAWGSNDFGESAIPSDLSDVIDVVGGNYHGAALMANGTVRVWGNNYYGQKRVPAGLNTVTQLSSGPNHIMALKANKTVVGWGENTYGQLSVPTGLTNVKAITAGGAHTIALLTNGTVRAWGNNELGQMDIPVGLTNVVSIAAGENHTVALRADSTVVVWGDNSDGQSNPPAGLHDVIAIASGSAHSLALRRNGTVIAWGNNSSRQSTVPPGLVGVIAITAGLSHSAALKADGTIIVWGGNTHGQTTLSNKLTNVVKLSSGANFLLAMTDSDAVFARTMTRSRTSTLTRTKSQTRTRTLTPTLTPITVLMRQTNLDGSAYRDVGIIRVNGGGEVFMSARNHTSKTLNDVVIRFNQTATDDPERTANCFYAAINKIAPYEKKLVKLLYSGPYTYWDRLGSHVVCAFIEGNRYRLDDVAEFYVDGVRKTAPVSIGFVVRDSDYRTPTPSRTPTSTRTPHPPVLRNPAFEGGRGHWTTTTRSGSTIVQKIPPITRGGDWLAIFGDANNEIATLSQTFYVLPNQDRLTFWYKIRSTERCGFTYDPVRILVNGVVKWQLDACYYQASAAWQSVTIKLPSATNVTVTFDMRTNNLNPSVWFVDDLEVW